MAQIPATWDGTKWILGDGLEISHEGLQRLFKEGPRQAANGEQKPLSKLMETASQGIGKLTQQIEFAVPEDIQAGLESGLRPTQVAIRRVGAGQGSSEDYRFALGQIDQDEWLASYTRVQPNDWADDQALPEKRLLSAMAMFEDLSTNRENLKYWVSRIPFVGTGVEVGELVKLRGAVNRFNAGEADSGDYLLLGQFIQENRWHENQDQKAWYKRVTQGGVDIMTSLPGYVAEFALPAGLAARAGAGAAKMTMRAATKAGIKGVTRKLSGRVAAVVARSAVQALGMPQQIAAEAERRRLTEGESPLTAYSKAFIGQSITAASEALGGTISGTTRKMAQKGYFPKKLAQFMMNKHASIFGKGKVAKFAKRTQLQAPPLEMVEEYFEEFARAATVSPGDSRTLEEIKEGRYKDLAVDLMSQYLGFLGIPAGAAVIREALGEGPQITLAKDFRERLAAARKEREKATEAPPAEPAAEPTEFQAAVQEVLAPEPIPATETPEPTPVEEIPEAEVSAEHKRTQLARDFISQHPDQWDALANLPEIPTRTQFAEAAGVPRKNLADLGLDALARARIVQMSKERLAAQQAPRGGPSFLRVLELPEAQKEKVLAFPEAEDAIRQELEAMSKWDIAKRFGFPKVRSRESMIREILAKQVKPYQKEISHAEKLESRPPEAPPTGEGVLGGISDQNRPGENRPELRHGAEAEAQQAPEAQVGAAPAPLSERAQRQYDQLRDLDKEGLASAAKAMGYPLSKEDLQQDEDTIRRALAQRMVERTGRYQELTPGELGPATAAAEVEAVVPQIPVSQPAKTPGYYVPPAGSPNAPDMHKDMAVEGAGWKLHLAVSKENRDAVTQKLREKGVLFKEGRSSGQKGKDYTIYLGSKDKADRISQEIEAEFGELLDVPQGSTLNEDQPFTDKVMGRFDVIERGDPTFHQYGFGGVPALMSDIRQDMGRGMRDYDYDKVRRILRKRFGEFFTGTEIQPVPAAPEKAKPPLAPPAVLSLEQLNDRMKELGVPVEVTSMREPSSSQEKAAQQLAQAFGHDVRIITSTAEISFVDERVRGPRVLYLDERAAEEAIWYTAGHELAHATEVDVLKALVGEARLDQFGQQYMKRLPPDMTGYRKYLIDDKGNKTDWYWREAMAEMVGTFFTDGAFREQLLQEQPTLWQRLVDALLKLFGRAKNLTDPDALAVLNELKEQRDRVAARRAELIKGPGRPSNDVNGQALAMARIDEAIDAWAAQENQTVTPERKEEWTKEILKDLRERHALKYDPKRRRNAARKMLRAKSGQTKITLSKVENAGKDHSSMDVPWDTIGRAVAAEFPDIMGGVGYEEGVSATEEPDYAARAFALIRQGDEKILDLTQDVDLFTEVLNDALYGPPDSHQRQEAPNAPLSYSQRMFLVSQNWTDDDWTGYNQWLQEIADQLSEEAHHKFSVDDQQVRETLLSLIEAQQAGDKGLFTFTAPAVARYLTEEELGGLGPAYLQRVVQHFEGLKGKTGEAVAAAQAGAAKQEWYQFAHQALFTIFGDQAPRFVNVLAATSPQRSAQTNLKEALRIWDAWEEAGEPFEPDKVREFLLGLQPKVLGASVNNLVTAFSEVNPLNAELSGWKVRSFRKNLLGDLSAVTVDRWLAEFFGVRPDNAFDSHTLYLALTAVVRRAAQQLNIEPAEAQSAIWSFLKAASAAKIGEKAKAKGKEVVKALRQESIAAVPEFAELLNDPEIQQALRKLRAVAPKNLRKAARLQAPPVPTGPLPGTETRAGEARLARIAERVPPGISGRAIAGVGPTLMFAPSEPPPRVNWEGITQTDAMRSFMERQRYLGRANTVTTIAGRTLQYKYDEEIGPPEYHPHAEAEAKAAKRVQADADGEKNRILEYMKAHEHADLGNDPRKWEEEMVVINMVLNDAMTVGALGSREAADDAWYLSRYRREARSWISRVLNMRDPICMGSPVAKRARKIMEAIFDTDSPETTWAILERLRELEISIDQMQDALQDELATMQLINVIMIERAGGTWADKMFEFYSNSIFSGPHTHAKNAISNTGFGLLMLGPERFVEALLNEAAQQFFGKKVSGAQLGEFKYILKGMWAGLAPGLRNFASTWAYEQSALAEQLGITTNYAAQDWDVYKTEVLNRRFALKGTWGRFVRSFGWRPLSASDDMFKTIYAYSVVGAHAYRQAKRFGLDKQHMARYIESAMKDRRSTAWTLAYNEALEATFMQAGWSGTQKLKKAARGLRKLPFGRFLIPTYNFPLNNFEAAMARLPGIGLWPLWRLCSEKHGHEVNFNKILARQMVGGAITAAVASLYYGGDDDTPVITGSSPRNYLARDLAWAVAPPLSIRYPWGGQQFFSYAGLEPASTILPAIIDFLDNRQKGKSLTDSQWDAFLRQITDKTFLQNLGDIVNAFTDPEASGIPQLTQNVLVGFVPNIIRQPWRVGRNEVYDTRIRKGDDFGTKVRKTLAKAELPVSGVIHKYDKWGRVIQPSSPATPWWYRVISPVKLGKRLSERVPADVVLWEWNQAHQTEAERDLQYHPSLPKPFITIRGRKELLSTGEYERYVQRSGEIALERANRINFHDPPTARDIKKIEAAFTTARATARREIIAARNQSE